MNNENKIQTAKKTAVEVLIEKAASTHDSQDAMRFSQAAQNVANALISSINAEKMRQMH